MRSGSAIGKVRRKHPSVKFLVAHWKNILIVLILGCLIIFWFAFDLKKVVNPERIQKYLKAIPTWKAVLIYSAIYIFSIRPFIPIPPTAYTLLGGLVFGTFLGTALTVFSATFNAALTFLIAQRFRLKSLERWVKKKGKIQAVLEKIRNASFKSILLIRLSPVGPPFDLVSYAAGVAKISFWGHFFGTMLGILPGTFLLSYLGASASSGKIKVMILPVFLVVLLLILVPWYLERRKRRE